MIADFLRFSFTRCHRNVNFNQGKPNDDKNLCFVVWATETLRGEASFNASDRKTPDCVTAEAALCSALSLNANRMFSKLNYPEWKVERELKALCSGLGHDSAAMRAVRRGMGRRFSARRARNCVLAFVPLEVVQLDHKLSWLPAL